jgi:HEPN domain-containing protein
MRSPDEVRQSVVRSWVDSARCDLQLAEIALNAPGYDGYAQIGFHAQQSVEKMLKAALVTYGIHPEEHHNLAALRAQLGRLDRRLGERLQSADVLTPYAARYRYPTREGRRPHIVHRADVTIGVELAQQACATLAEMVDRRMGWSDPGREAPSPARRSPG